MRVRNLSLSGKGSVEHLATVDPIYIDKSPTRQRPFALSTTCQQSSRTLPF
jgi:hypothetical protein